MILSRIHGFSLIAALLVAAVPALADDAQADARELYGQGSAAFERGDFAIAAVAFEAAFERATSGAAAMGAALAWDQVGDFSRAANNYARALTTGGLESAEVETATRRLADLRREVCIVRISGESGSKVSLGGASAVPIPLTTHLPPGERTVSIIETDGTSREHKFQCDPGASVSLRGNLRPTRPPEGAASTAPVSASVDESTGPSATLVLGVVGMGMSAALAGVTIGLGKRTSDLESSYEASGYTDAGMYDEGTTFRTWTNVSLGSAIGFAVVGATLLIVSSVHSDASGTSLRDLSIRF